MELLQALALPPEGWTCLVGGGGKSSLMLRLVEERARHGLPALAATTTHIGRGQGLAAGSLAGTVEELEAARREGLTACAAVTEPETGKLTAPPAEVLAHGLRLFGFGVAEADGAKRLPMKAPAGTSPASSQTAPWWWRWRGCPPWAGPLGRPVIGAPWPAPCWAWARRRP